MKKRQRMNNYLRRKSRKLYIPQILKDLDRSNVYVRYLASTDTMYYNKEKAEKGER